MLELLETAELCEEDAAWLEEDSCPAWEDATGAEALWDGAPACEESTVGSEEDGVSPLLKELSALGCWESTVPSRSTICGDGSEPSACSAQPEKSANRKTAARTMLAICLTRFIFFLPLGISPDIHF